MQDSALARAIATLIGILLVSVAIAIPLTVVLAWPLISVSESVLHLGCESNTIDGQQVWVCPDGIGYAFPGIVLVVVLTVIGVVIGVLWRRDSLGSPEDRFTLAMIVSLAAGALALLVGAAIALCGVFDVSGAYGRWLIPVGLAVAAAISRSPGGPQASAPARHHQRDRRAGGPWCADPCVGTGPAAGGGAGRRVRPRRSRVRDDTNRSPFGCARLTGPGVGILDRVWTSLRFDRNALDAGDALSAVLALIAVLMPALFGDWSVWDIVIFGCGVAILAIISLRVVVHLTDRLPTRRRHPPT